MTVINFTNNSNNIGYRITNDGDYELVNFYTGEILDTMHRVGMLLKDGILIAHGDAKEIKFSAENEILFTGRFPVDEINKVLTTPGYMPTVFNQLQDRYNNS